MNQYKNNVAPMSMNSTINSKFAKNQNIIVVNQKQAVNIMHSKKHSFNANDSQVILGATMNI